MRATKSGSPQQSKGAFFNLALSCWIYATARSLSASRFTKAIRKPLIGIKVISFTGFDEFRFWYCKTRYLVLLSAACRTGLHWRLS